MNEWGNTVPCSKNLALKVVINITGHFLGLNALFKTSDKLNVNQYAVLCEFAYFGI